jgi:septum formation protein
MAEGLILASASAARARLLAAAGIACRAVPADIDEAALKRSFRAAGGGGAAECALALAEAKARQVAREDNRSLVIGADQLLVCGDLWLDKPGDRAAARRQLQALRGRSHDLETAVCAVRGGERLWHAVSTPRLSMRMFSDRFLDAYLDAEGEAVLGSVGAYRLEGRGVQLFDRVEGDYFSVLGLPLLELAAFLRDRRVFAS